MSGLPGFDGDVQVPDWTRINLLFNPEANAIRAAEAIQAQNKAQSGTQDLEDRTFLRNSARDLAQRNALALAGAAARPGIGGTSTVNTLSEYDLRKAQGDIALGGMPVMPYGAGAQNTTPSGAPSGAAPSGPGQGQSLLVGETPIHADKAAQQRVGEIAQEEGVNPEWARRTAFAESGTNANSMAARGDSGEIGTMQLMPGTAAGLRVDPTVPEQNWRGGVQYLKQMKEMFNDPVIATAAYNAGPGKVSKWLAGQAQLPASTVAYVGKVFGTTDGTTLLSRALAGAHGHAVPGVQISSLDGTVETPQATPAPVGVQVASTGPVALPMAQTDEAGVTNAATPGAVQSLLGTYRNAQLPPEQQVAVDPSYLANRDASVPGQGAAPAAASAAGASVATAPVLTPAASSAPAPMPQQAAPSPQTPPGAPQAQSYGPTLQDWPAGTKPITDRLGRPYRAPGTPEGMMSVQAPNGTIGSVRMPGVAPQLEFRPVGGQMLVFDKSTGREVSRSAIPETGRGVQVEVSGGHQMNLNGHLVGPVIPFSGRKEQGVAYKADQEKYTGMTQVANDTLATMPRLNEMADIARGLATGPTATIRGRAQALLETMGVSPERASTLTGISSASAFQEFVKLALSTAGAAAKADLGSNNGIQSTQLYLGANPGVELMPDANKRMTNMLRVAMQSKLDYATDGIAHFGKNEANFLGSDGKGSGNYIPLTSFNHAWLTQNNPQVYAAATGILNGDPYSKWADRLRADPAMAHRAVAIAARIDPNVTVPVAGDKTKPAREILGAQ